jgi:hypothetical protein
MRTSIQQKRQQSISQRNERPWQQSIRQEEEGQHTLGSQVYQIGGQRTRAAKHPPWNHRRPSLRQVRRHPLWQSIRNEGGHDTSQTLLSLLSSLFHISICLAISQLLYLLLGIRLAYSSIIRTHYCSYVEDSQFLLMFLCHFANACWHFAGLIIS